MEATTLNFSLFLLIMVTGRTATTTTTTTVLPQCPTDARPDEDACLLPNPSLLDWRSAHHFCRSKGGFLIGSREMTRPRLSELIASSVVWTALGPHEGHLQWLMQRPVKAQGLPWQEGVEWDGHQCASFHFHSQVFRPSHCDLHLASICLLVPPGEELYTGVEMELQMTMDNGRAVIREEDGWVQVREDMFQQVSLTCSAHLTSSGATASPQPRVFWSKDGTYLSVNGSTLVPASISSPSSPLLLQGAYWCEAWLPDSPARHASNKVLLTFLHQETLLLRLQDTHYLDSPPVTSQAIEVRVREAFSNLLPSNSTTIHVASIVRQNDAVSDSVLLTSRVEVHFPTQSAAFNNVRVLTPNTVRAWLERKGFLASSTVSFLTGCMKRRENLPYGNSVRWMYTSIGEVNPSRYRCEAADGKLLTGHCRWNYTHGATIHFDRRDCQHFDFCPRGYTGIADAFCVSRTSAGTWDEGFRVAHAGKHSMSFLDTAHLHEYEEVFLILYQGVQRWLEDVGGGSLVWLPARRLAPFAPLAVLSPALASNHSSNSSVWLRSYNVSWAAKQPFPEQDCLALDMKASVLLTLPCDDALPFLTVIDMRGLSSVPTKQWRKITPGLITTNDATCPGWSETEYPGGLGICFKVFKNKYGLSWDKAAALCDARGAQLPDPSDGFLDWVFRQYVDNTDYSLVWMRSPPTPGSREMKGRRGTFLNWRAGSNHSKPYPALTSNGWISLDPNDTIKNVMCQKNKSVPEVSITVFEEFGDVLVKVRSPDKLTISSPQCFVNGHRVSFSENINPFDDDEECNTGENGSECDYYDDNEDNGSGDERDFSFSSGNTRRVLRVNSSSEGYYVCHVWMDSPFRLITSNVLVYRHSDATTFSVTLSRQTRYSPELHDAAINPKALSPNDSCVTAFLKKVQEGFDNTLRVISDNLYFTPDTQTDALLLNFHVQFANSGRFVALTENEVFEAITTALGQSSFSDCRAVSARSTVGCYKETQWNLTWPLTQGAQIVVPAEFCVTDEGDLVTRRCVGDFIRGYHWGTKFGKCTNQTLSVTQQLWHINQVSKPLDSALLAKLTDDGNSLNAADVYFTAQKMQSISRQSTVLPGNLKHIVKTLNNVMETEGEVLEQLHGVFNTSSILLQAFESISFKVKLPHDKSDQVLHSDSRLVSLARVSLAPNSSIIGYHSWRKDESNVEEQEEDENVMRKENEEDWRRSQVSLILPDTLMQHKTQHDLGGVPQRRAQTVFAVYRNSKLFHDNSSFSNHTVDGHIIQATYSGLTVTHFQEPVRIYFKTSRGGKHSKCVFWDFSVNEGRGGWSTEGCRNDGRHGDHVLCLCHHLTCFAHLVNFDEEGLGDVHKVILDKVSIIGCALSIIGLLSVLVTFCLFPKWRRRLSNQILAHLASAILCSLVVFLAGIQQNLMPTVCRSVAVVLHYFILASFFWMLVEAVHQYLRLVKVLGTYIPRFIWKASVCAWGVPLVPITAVLVYDASLYDSDQQPQNTICWMSSTAFKYAFLPPLALTMATNLVLFVLIIYSTTCGRIRITSTLSERQLRIRQLQMAVSVFFLLGLTWVFGLLTFWQPSLVLSYLFCITNTTQGFFVFLFYVCRDRETKKLWMDFLSVTGRNEGASKYSTSVATSKTSEVASVSYTSTPVKT